MKLVQRGGEEEVDVTSSGFSVPYWASTPGPLQISGEDRFEWVGVNLFRPELSDLGWEEGDSIPKPYRPWYRDFPFPAACACLSIVVLLIEWLLFHRGWI